MVYTTKFTKGSRNPRVFAKKFAEGGMVPDKNGMVEPGNIDLTKRPVVHNPDGTISTVRSIGIGGPGSRYPDPKGHVTLIPTVSPDGAVLSDEDAVRLHRMSGKHLGKFDTWENSEKYAKSLHEDQDKMYSKENDED